jgi:hypothetical protein
MCHLLITRSGLMREEMGLLFGEGCEAREEATGSKLDGQQPRPLPPFACLACSPGRLPVKHDRKREPGSHG